ncbi:MAG: hypothetical protein LQ343_006631 [Gyalolechia ehrenbergii]|nr:MAG: hypothetical protein LQ343_006631 [Gyalolechia ehrenbergii]
MAHPSWSDDNGLSLSQQVYQASGDSIEQQAISTEEIWDSYFEGDGDAYQGIDEEWIQGTVIESENSMSLHTFSGRDCCPLHQQDQPRHQSETGASGLHGTNVRNLAEEQKQNKSKRAVVSPLPEIPSELAEPTSMARHTASGNDIPPRRLACGDDHCDRTYTFSPSSNQTLKLQENKGEVAESHGETDRLHACNDDHQSQEGFLRALKHETEDLLRTPLTPLSSDLISEAGFPLGVERARTEYEQGLLSTGTFFRDCLPPALLRYKRVPSPEANTDSHGLLTRQNELSEKSISVPHQSKRYQNDGLNPAGRPRNLSKEEQFRRINQAPLSAIYEESDPSPESQGECPCEVCKHRINGQRIVWFHLCPRYKALSQQHGIQYEPYEARVIMHHGHDRSSLGLVIEGPMEDRFVPKVEPPAEAAKSVSKRVKAPKPQKLDPRSLHSAASCNSKIIPPTTTSSKLPPVPTPALQRPISPTRVSRPSSLIPLSSLLCPKATKSEGDNTPPCAGVIDSQENVHPAFRIGDVLPKEWTTPPTRSQSAASRDDSPQRPHSIRSENVRLSVGASEASGELPTRSDSLGAPTHSVPFQPSDKHLVHQHPAQGLRVEQNPASGIADYAFPPPLLSPSAGHERTPSEYLCPSTPSTSSNQRSSTSSYGGSSLQHLCQGNETATATTPKGDLAPSTKDPLENNDHQQGQQPVTPQSSYYTAPSSALASSCCLPTPETAHTAPSSLERLRSSNPNQNSPYFHSRGYHWSQASQQSTAQLLNSLRFQRNSGFTSGTTLLNGSAFEFADETSCSEAEEVRRASSERHSQNGLLDRRNQRNIFTRDSLVTAGAPESRRPDILASSSDFHSINNSGNSSGTVRANPLLTVGATEAHCTNIVTAAPNAKHVSRRASVPVGQGIADSLSSPYSITASRMNNNPSTPSLTSNSSSGGPNEEHETYINHNRDPNLPLRRSLLVQQNLCSHIKLQNYLGMNVSSPGSWRQQHKKMQSMTMLDRFPTETRVKKDEGPGFKRVVKKGSRRFREGGVKMMERVKAGWRVRQEEWLDSDDGRD